MKLNNRFIFGILSLVLAAVIAFVALPTIARQTNGKTEIVRITQPVLKGEQITGDNAEVVEVGGYRGTVFESPDSSRGWYGAPWGQVLAGQLPTSPNSLHI